MKKIQSLVEYLEAINTKKEKLSKPGFDMDFNNFWYRGQENKKWKLVPSLYRNLWNIVNDKKKLKNYKHSDGDLISNGSYINHFENQIDYHFHKQLYNYLPYSPLLENKWIRYYLKQHYGLQTRLLDWTENHLIALFFAIVKPLSVDPLVWIMSPSMLNRFTLDRFGYNSKSELIIPAFHTFSEYIKPSIETENKKNLSELAEKYLHFNFKDDKDTYPLAIEPLYFEKRIFNQNSCFTVHGNKINGFEINQSNKFVDRIIIDRNFRVKLLKELNEAGVSYGKIYPDLTGFCEEIKLNYNERFEELKHSISYYSQ